MQFSTQISSGVRSGMRRKELSCGTYHHTCQSNNPTLSCDLPKESFFIFKGYHRFHWSMWLSFCQSDMDSLNSCLRCIWLFLLYRLSLPRSLPREQSVVFPHQIYADPLLFFSILHTRKGSLAQIGFKLLFFASKVPEIKYTKDMVNKKIYETWKLRCGSLYQKKLSASWSTTDFLLLPFWWTPYIESK